MLSKDATVEDKVLAYIGTRKQAFSPGTKWEYSNSAYILLGYIIEDVTEMTYFEAVRQYIFKPLHMNRSSFDMPKVTSGDKATGYTVFTAAAQTEAPAIDPYGPFSAGAMCSTVEDLYKWHRGLQSGKVISEAMQEKAYTPFLHKYGFGWFIDTLQGKRIVFHDGGIQGFNSFISRITADDACVILLNNKPGHNLWPLTKKYSLCFIKKTSIKILRGCAYPAMWQWR
jgi:CubicO group peptidase (beta-lactamase class C family)